ncbi:MAG: hypothetical protein M1308_23055 [Actinobacteria bacterium]|nr:hypothetical protein [Actinomycetota bacterium]MCL5073744.1 hypothetical protein [Actinomycetota bacterium]
MKTKTEALLTCPKCSTKQKVDMPTNACQYFYKCISCNEIIKPKEGDCCVFCSYADIKCPSKQVESNIKLQVNSKAV